MVWLDSLEDLDLFFKLYIGFLGLCHEMTGEFLHRGLKINFGRIIIFLDFDGFHSVPNMLRYGISCEDKIMIATLYALSFFLPAIAAGLGFSVEAAITLHLAMAIATALFYLGRAVVSCMPIPALGPER